MRSTLFTSIAVSSTLLATLALSGAAVASPVLCNTAANNHMLIDDSQVSACLAAGTGNLTGNPLNDQFLIGVGTDYEFASKSDGVNPFALDFTQENATGIWMFSDTFWETYGQGAISFKFGTGNQPDEWFVYSLEEGVSAGDWEFVNVFGTGGGLSHMNLYGKGAPAAVPEPLSLGLLSLGLAGMGFFRRRKDLEV